MKTNLFNFSHGTKGVTPAHPLQAFIGSISVVDTTHRVFLFFSLLLFLGIAPQANAATTMKVKGGTIYFDNSKTNWDGVAFIYGRDWTNSNHSKVAPMTHIENTHLYYVNPSPWSNDNSEFDNPNYIRFVACTDWKTADWGSDNYKCASGYTNIHRENYTFNSIHWYKYEPASGSDNASITCTYLRNDNDYNAAWNHKQTLYARISADGIDFSTPSTTPAQIRVEGKAFGAYNACNNNSYKQLAKDAAYADVDAPDPGIGFTATAKMLVSNVSSSYTFLGFYKSDGTQLKSAAEAAEGQVAGTFAYEYTVSKASTIHARFQENKFTITLESCTASSTTAGPITTGTATAKEPAGKEVTGFIKSGNEITFTGAMADKAITFNATAAGTVTAQFAYKTPTIEVASKATYTLGGAAIKLNPKYSDLATDATYSWTGVNVTFSDATAANPNISVATAGEYTITLTATNGTGEGSKTSEVKTITLTATDFTGDDCGTCFQYTAQ